MVFTMLFPTRWNDNDVYGHINNTIYYAAMDTTINNWLMSEAGFDPIEGDTLAVCVTSSCTYAESGAYPDVLRLELGTGRVGTSSVTWKLGIFRNSDGARLADGEFVHVFIDRVTRRPSAIPSTVRTKIEASLSH